LFTNPYLEQTTIATALSDADGLITGLENSLQKKRNIKQRCHATAFATKEGWEVKKLGSLFNRNNLTSSW
jgi:type I restriction enzyme S subunit